MTSKRFNALLAAAFSGTIMLFGPVDGFSQTTVQTQIAENRDEQRPARPIATVPEDKPSSSSARFSPAMTRVGVQTADTMPMSLSEAIRRALQNNNDIEVARTDVKLAESALKRLLGTYDGTLNVSPTFDRSSNTGQTATRDFRVQSDYVRQLEAGGGNIRGFFNNSRTENQFNQQQVTSGSGSSGSAVFSSVLGVTYTQPLWRNLATDATRRQIKIQRKRLSQSDADFRRQAITTISTVQTAYWDLVFALRNQQNQVANVNLSRENLRQVEAKIAAGTNAPLQKAEVETELANRESELIAATQQVSTAENRLKQLILREAGAAEWSRSLVPTDAPIVSDDPLNVDDAMKDAMEYRPELRRLKLEKEINTLDVSFFRNQTKPRVDLVSTFSLNGLSFGNVNTASFVSPVFAPQNVGSETSSTSYLYNLICRSSITAPGACTNIPVVNVAGSPEYYKGGFNRSLSNLFRSDAANFSVGVTFSFSLRNRSAKADLATARLQTERIDAQTRTQEQAVIVEVRNAVQAAETARQRVKTARRARENAEIQLEGERQLFEFGKSTTFFLFQRENALTNARNAEIRAETDYNKAMAELQRVTSTTLQMNNIEVDSPIADQ